MTRTHKCFYCNVVEVPMSKPYCSPECEVAAKELYKRLMHEQLAAEQMKVISDERIWDKLDREMKLKRKGLPLPEEDKESDENPIKHDKAGWYWGSTGPFPTRKKALSVMRAIFASGYRGRNPVHREYCWYCGLEKKECLKCRHQIHEKCCLKCTHYNDAESKAWRLVYKLEQKYGPFTHKKEHMNEGWNPAYMVKSTKPLYCVHCHKPIMDKYVIRDGLMSWHLKCYQATREKNVMKKKQNPGYVASKEDEAVDKFIELCSRPVETPSHPIKPMYPSTFDKLTNKDLMNAFKRGRI